MVRTVHEPAITPIRRVLGERNDNVSVPSPTRRSSKKPRDSFMMRIATDSPIMNEQPPSSVAGLTDEETPVTKVNTPTRPQSRRPRPSPTPTRASPNPRQKKNPRLTMSLVLEPKTSQGRKSLERSESPKDREKSPAASQAPTGDVQRKSPSQSSKERSRRKSSPLSQPRKSQASRSIEPRRRRQTLTPAALSRLSGKKVVVGDLAKPLEYEGEDPLLLAPDWEPHHVERATPSRVVKSFPFKPYDPRNAKAFESQGSSLGLPKTVRRKRVKEVDYADGFGSDSDEAFDNTFADIMVKRGESSRQVMSAPDAASSPIHLHRPLETYEMSDEDDDAVVYPWTQFAPSQTSEANITLDASFESTSTNAEEAEVAEEGELGKDAVGLDESSGGVPGSGSSIEGVESLPIDTEPGERKNYIDPSSALPPSAESGADADENRDQVDDTAHIALDGLSASPDVLLDEIASETPFSKPDVHQDEVDTTNMAPDEPSPSFSDSFPDDADTTVENASDDSSASSFERVSDETDTTASAGLLESAFGNSEDVADQPGITADQSAASSSNNMLNDADMTADIGSDLSASLSDKLSDEANAAADSASDEPYAACGDMPGEADELPDEADMVRSADENPAPPALNDVPDEATTNTDTATLETPTSNPAIGDACLTTDLFSDETYKLPGNDIEADRTAVIPKEASASSLGRHNVIAIPKPGEAKAALVSQQPDDGECAEKGEAKAELSEPAEHPNGSGDEERGDEEEEDLLQGDALGQSERTLCRKQRLDTSTDGIEDGVDSPLPAHTPIIQRLRRSLHAGSTPFLVRSTGQKVSPDLAWAGELNADGSANRGKSPEPALRQSSLYIQAAWQTPSDSEAEEEEPVDAVEQDVQEMASLDDAAIDVEWEALLRRSGCSELYKAAVQNHKAQADDQCDYATATAAPECEPSTPVNETHHQAVPSPIPAHINLEKNSPMRRVASFEEIAMSATGVDLDESDSHIGDITADTVDAGWESFGSDDEDVVALKDDVDQEIAAASQALETLEPQTSQVGGAEADHAETSVERRMEKGAESGPKITETVSEGSRAETAHEVLAQSMPEKDLKTPQMPSKATEAVQDDDPVSVQIEADEPASTDKASDTVEVTIAPLSVESTTPISSPAVLPTTLPAIPETSPEVPPPADAVLEHELSDETLAVDASTARAETDETMAAPAQGKIILKIIECGTIKVEPEEAPSVKEVPPPATPKAVNHIPGSTTPKATPPSVAFAWGLPSSLALPKTRQEQPSDVARQAKSSDATPAPLAVPPGHALPTAILSASARGPSFNQPNRPHAPSRLANVISQNSSPIHHTADETVDKSDAESSQSDPISPRQEVDLSLSFDAVRASTSSSRSILHELARAEGPAAAERLKNVVEITSLDPAAAARATALLKMNHNYIEHGLLQSRDAPQTPKLSQEELLYQAELDLVSQAGSTPARVREGTAFSTSTNLPVPGAWVSTPIAKRKREEAKPETVLPAWGITDWKRLEKVHRKEKDAWLKERSIKPLPTGFFSWAKRSLSLSRPAEPTNTAWEPRKVVEAFISGEAKEGRTWHPETLELRVKALEKRVDDKLARLKPEEVSPSKRVRVASVPQTPARSKPLETPKSVQRVMSWVWGSAEAQAPVIDDLCDMRQTGPDTSRALESSALGLSTSSSATSFTMPLNTPASRLYPSLQPSSVSQRSTALKSLFPAMHPLGESVESRPAGRTVQQKSVKDMVRGFEKNGLGELLNSRRG